MLICLLRSNSTFCRFLRYFLFLIIYFLKSPVALQDRSSANPNLKSYFRQVHDKANNAVAQMPHRTSPDHVEFGINNFHNDPTKALPPSVTLFPFRRHPLPLEHANSSVSPCNLTAVIRSIAKVDTQARARVAQLTMWRPKWALVQTRCNLVSLAVDSQDCEQNIRVTSYRFVTTMMPLWWPL